MVPRSLGGTRVQAALREGLMPCSPLRVLACAIQVAKHMANNTGKRTRRGSSCSAALVSDSKNWQHWVAERCQGQQNKTKQQQQQQQQQHQQQQQNSNDKNNNINNNTNSPQNNKLVLMSTLF
ncbi:unnamed protein product [Polarella glacialis]|uniref:Uncharacterized protein n=1 Tax=Polarella glacialis TaxID=89957 RepID=A0A813DJA0_POLGL|nr:unnamed protein product [Polarella glacialis]